MSRFEPEDEGRDLLKEHPVLYTAVVVFVCLGLGACLFLVWLCFQ